ncbi:HlyD family secretion protein [Paraferrimonas sedimenticola]|uniref:Toxin secretion, membrane fusion protein n=1 Tax=Paraferrimonas sedimenticola TaxID=375674 RepID=A0AA37RY46_9GAMM|nr:HlyD family efflux transporter periplasmic adaptor subunit [Paraferrimonas sedimenticola]GLP96887.1 toxin secretion, membrane fusion protein [Paraferrimonas sedimenticola]
MSGLFRKQAVTQQYQRLEGSISLAQPLSLTRSIVILLLVAVALASFVVTQDFSKKETVHGYLRPSAGLIKVYPNLSGAITHLLVREGQQVDKGQVLAKVRHAQGYNANPSLSKAVSQTLLEQQTRAEQALNFLKQTQALETKQLQQQIRDIEAALENNQKQQSIANQRLSILQAQFDDRLILAEKGYLSEIELNQTQDTLLQLRQQLSVIEATQIDLTDEYNRLNSLSKRLPHDQALALNEHATLLANAQQRYLAHQSQLNGSILAPSAGTVTAIRSYQGETLSQGQPLLSILPKDSLLVAELLLPSRSIGFVEPGQLARLRFDAYPYQQYGFLDSKVEQLDGALQLPSESKGPFQLQEPVYRVQATLSQQGLGELPLRAGMLLQADVHLKRQSLWRWLVQPFSGISGRLR